MAGRVSLPDFQTDRLPRENILNNVNACSSGVSLRLKNTSLSQKVIFKPFKNVVNQLSNLLRIFFNENCVKKFFNFLLAALNFVGAAILNNFEVMCYCFSFQHKGSPFILISVH